MTDNQPDMQKLIPCPFCGKEPIVKHNCCINTAGDYDEDFSTRCCFVELYAHTEEALATKWNTRADLSRPDPSDAARKEALGKAIFEAIRHYHLQYSADDNGNGYPILDALSCKHKTVKQGIEECELLADEVYTQVLPFLSAPSPMTVPDKTDD